MSVVVFIYLFLRKEMVKMALLMIRRNQLENQLKDCSYTIMSTTDRYQCINFDIPGLKSALKRGTKIENLGLNGAGELYGTCGSLDRYPIAVYSNINDIARNTNNYKVVQNSLVIVGRYEDNVLAVCDGRGCGPDGCSPSPMEGTDEQLISTIKKNADVKIANASVVNDSFIRCLSGNFIDIPGKSKMAQLIEAQKQQYNKKMQELKEKNEAINEKEKALREDLKQNVKSNKTRIVEDSTVKVGDESYKVDSDTVKRMQMAREQALQRNKADRASKLTKDNPNFKVSDGKSVNSTSPWAQIRMSKSEVDGLTVDEMIVMAATTLKYIDPFLYAAFISLKKVYMEEPTGNLTTMGVSDDTLYIVESTVVNIPLPQISWILLHEMSHVIQMHNIRGRNKRTSQEHYVYNVACDLFINKMIGETYGCRPGVPVVKAMYGANAPIGLEFHCQIDPETGEAKSALYDESVDIHNITVEGLYAKLMQENREKLNQSGNNGKEQSGDGQDQQQGGSGQSGNNKDQQDGQSGQNGQNQQGQGHDSDGQSSGQQSGSQDGSGGQQDDYEQSGQSGNGQDKKGKGSGNGQGGQNGSDPYPNQLTLDGKPIASVPKDGQKGDDLVEDEGSSSHGDSDDARERWGRDFVNKIIQKATNMFNDIGGSPMLRMAQDNVLRDFVWTNFVKQFLTKVSGDEWTYKNPDKKMMNYKLVMKGRTPREQDSEEDVYVCIDVSGSVSDADLYKAFEYIRVLLKKLNLTGCVCYWSTNVDGPYPFKNSRDLVALRNKGYKSTGGTDANQLFEWIKSRGRKHAPKLVIVLTDGCFAPLRAELKPRGCETLWIITDAGSDYRKHKFTFGKVAPLIPKR